jgi:antitoxin component YwqK of YwqJK toxin-antitoxin module
VWVEPPQHFTGVWTTYFPNGQKSHKIHYRDGRYFGEFTAYYPNGQRAYVQHYDEHGASVAYTGWYDDGKPISANGR